MTLKNLTDEQRRAVHAAQMREYRRNNPDRVLAQRLRDAVNLLKRHGYCVTMPAPEMAAGLTAPDTDTAANGSR